MLVSTLASTNYFLVPTTARKGTSTGQAYTTHHASRKQQQAFFTPLGFPAVKDRRRETARARLMLNRSTAYQQRPWQTRKARLQTAPRRQTKAFRWQQHILWTPGQRSSLSPNQTASLQHAKMLSCELWLLKITANNSGHHVIDFIRLATPTYNSTATQLSKHQGLHGSCYMGWAPTHLCTFSCMATKYTLSSQSRGLQ